MVKRYVLKKELKKIGNSEGFTFSAEEKRVWKMDKGDIITIEILEVEHE
jgi:hypothetical protein